jgi:hypothetical protein
MIQAHARSPFSCSDTTVQAKIGYFGSEFIGGSRRALHEKNIFRSDVFVDSAPTRISSAALECILARESVPLDIPFVQHHELVDPIQTGKDLKEAFPELDDILGCRGRGCVGEELAQIPAVGMLEYESVRAELLQRSVELDYVGRRVGAEPQ